MQTDLEILLKFWEIQRGDIDIQKAQNPDFIQLSSFMAEIITARLSHKNRNGITFLTEVVTATMTLLPSADFRTTCCLVEHSGV